MIAVNNLERLCLAHVVQDEIEVKATNHVMFLQHCNFYIQMGVSPTILWLNNWFNLEQIDGHLSTVWTMGVVIFVNL